MTILEAASTYGLKEFRTSVGDNIDTIVDRIYHSREDKVYLVIQTLNNRFDWDLVEPNTPIRYLPNFALSEIDEITSRR